MSKNFKKYSFRVVVLITINLKDNKREAWKKKGIRDGMYAPLNFSRLPH
jgi:hypothetical protein